MGKCSGLKGGGHHRRALDVAEKKKSAKAAQRREQAAAGQRAVVLKEILTQLDPDCDLYLDAASCDRAAASQGNALPDLCRTHFRHEACTNKRCRFSKEHSIAEALSNVVSGTNAAAAADSDDNNLESEPRTIPALRHLPGMLLRNDKKTKQHPLLRRRRRPAVHHDHDDDDRETTTPTSPTAALNLLFRALSEGSSATNAIVACLDSDRDVVHWGMTCWHLCDQILMDGGCPDVRLRKYRALHRKLERRNAKLLGSRALGGSLRYAVGYFENSNSHSNHKKNKNNNKKKNPKKSKASNHQQPSLRPVLIFDYENPNVYKAFSESGLRKKYNNNNNNNNIHQLESLSLT